MFFINNLGVVITKIDGPRANRRKYCASKVVLALVFTVALPCLISVFKDGRQMKKKN